MAGVETSEKSNQKLKKQVYDPDKSLNFVISIDEEEWESIKPVQTEWSDRTTLVLQPGWTDLILDKIWQQYQLQCPFPMHSHKFFKRLGYPYLKFEGKCKECEAPIKGQILEKPTFFPYLINIETFNTRDIRHDESRQLRNNKRVKLKEKAKHTKPLKLRHLQANENLDDEGNLNPICKERPDLNSTAVISKLRHENKKEDTAAYPTDVVSQLINLKLDYPDYIRSFSTVPVVIRYWSKNQIDFWNEVAPLGFYISIDASGKFTLALNIVEGQKSRPIFFYNVVVKIGRKIYTLTQMLSSAHDVGEIASWLSAWVKNGASIPLGAVVDCALALLNSLCIIFNRCTFVEHLDKNMSILLGNSNELPICKIKRDKAHLIKASSVWNCFKGDNWVKKDLYLRIIGYSLNIELLSEIDEVVTALFVVSQSEHQSSQYLESFTVLKNKIATFDHKTFSNEKNENIQDCTHENCEILKEIDVNVIENGAMSNCSAKEYILQLKVKADKLLKQDKAKDSSTPNPYHLPDICANLINLYTQFSVWSNVMDRFYLYDPHKMSTSTGSEIYYKVTRIDYGFSAPVSLKEFLLEQKPIIDGATKLGRRLIKRLIERLGEEEKKEERKTKDVTIVPLAPTKTFVEILSEMMNAMNEGEGDLLFYQEPNLQNKKKANSLDCAISKTKTVEKTHIKRKQVLANQVAVHKKVKSIPQSDSDLDPKTKMRIKIFFIDLERYLITWKDFFFRLPFIDLEKCTLSVEEFQTLRVPNFVNGNIIDIFMNIKIRTEWKNIAVIPTSQSVFMVGDQWEGSHGKTWQMYHFKCDSKLIFIPYCFKQHWCLIILNMLNETAMHLNPFDLETEEHLDPLDLETEKHLYPLHLEPGKRHDYEKAFNHYLLNSDETNILKNKKWKWVKNEIKLYRQLDGHNCGPIVMYYMTIFANLNKYLDSQASILFKPNQFRFEIANLLLGWTDVSDDICLHCFNLDKEHYKSGFSKCKTCDRWAHSHCVEKYKTKLDLDIHGKCEYCQPLEYRCFYCGNIDEIYCDDGFSKCKGCRRWAHNCCIKINTKFYEGKCEVCQVEQKS